MRAGSGAGAGAGGASDVAVAFEVDAIVCMCGKSSYFLDGARTLCAYVLYVVIRLSLS